MTTSLPFHHSAHLLAPQISNAGCLAGYLAPYHGFVRG
jgi:hypothetical protein